ncbi:hypothetical protein CCNA_03988 [Caulobacter vibrioides NA1000]|uniref:Uncharacterized protein n=1 Tax=Caulobacter vibrioides (strain NA1000 / CB15N) TaxID=565050 RepID=A0A0H3IXV4_CAUVN|nr:hypothetical protein [Caulobacter vibrioides]YP_009020560.1 hypothetical protein CCNA_03988 [Caulobacter vibrioides NA1000]AHI88591.1 hypothetical protein CCNA_03988 [Caulobacter vibrioides NA1000]
MRLDRSTRPMAYAANDDTVADNAVAQNVGRNRDDLTPSLSAHAPAFGIGRQASAGVEQPLGQALGRERTRLLGDMADDGVNIGHRSLGPDYLRHEYGGGVWCGVPNVLSHSPTRSCGTVLPASKSASASASAARIASSSSSKMSGSGSAMPYDNRNLSRTNPEKPSFRPSSRSAS